MDPSLRTFTGCPQGFPVTLQRLQRGKPAGGRPALEGRRAHLRCGGAQVGRVPAAALGAGLEALGDADADPTQGKPHLVAYAAALQQRDYLAAIRALHRFFDYNAGADPRPSPLALCPKA